MTPLDELLTIGFRPRDVCKNEKQLAESETINTAAFEECTVNPHRNAPRGDHCELFSSEQIDDPSLSVALMSLVGSVRSDFPVICRGEMTTQYMLSARTPDLHLAGVQKAKCTCFYLNKKSFIVVV